MKRYFLYSAWVYSAFVVYGSLVPLDYNAIPLDVAWHRFAEIRYLNLGIGSRADWVANILLFIPLAFLWMEVLAAKSRLSRKVIASFFVGIFSVFLCVSIEFTQLFFPPRTVSINDIIAECAGAVIGVSIWWLVGEKFIDWLNKWAVENSSESNLDHYLQIYLVGLFLYNVMPLDLVISPVEIYHKWNEGRVILIPFTGLKESFAENLYEWGSEIALWIPVPILWQRRAGIASSYQLWARVFVAVVIIEFLQLFVYSRVTDITDILLALVGGGCGIGLRRFILADRGYEISGLPHSSSTNTSTRTIINGGIGYLLWCCVLMLIFWYPFDFEWSKGLVQEQLEGFFRIPFYAYYYGTEFRAITEVFHKILFFMPLGIVLAYILRSAAYRSLFFWGSFVVLMITAFMLEFVQVLLPEKIISSTDILLEVFGGQLGFTVGRNFFSPKVAVQYAQSAVVQTKFKRQVEHDPKLEQSNSKRIRNRDNRQRQQYMMNPENQKISLWLSWGALSGGVLVTMFGLLVISQLSVVPYNIRELIGGDYVLFRSFGLSIALFWCLGFPVWFLYRSIKKKLNPLLYYIYGTAIHSFFAWFFIRIAAPLESIYDVVGFPILAIPSELEVFFRFFSLFGIFSLALFGSVLCAQSIIDLGEKLGLYFVLGFICVAVMLPVCYWVVVVEAATDNLIELLTDEGHSFSIMAAFIYLFLFGFTGSILSVALVFHRVRIFIWAAGLFFLSFPLGYALLYWATESAIYKYGKMFSALQFLLSSDRAHYVTGSELFLRFCLANFALIVLVCFVQFFFWLSISACEKGRESIAS